MTNLLLRTYVSTQTAFASLTDRVSFEPQDARKEEGAETVQVIMIMGIFAIIVAAVFLGMKGTLTSLGTSVKNCIVSITGGNETCTWSSQS